MNTFSRKATLLAFVLFAAPIATADTIISNFPANNPVFGSTVSASNGDNAKAFGFAMPSGESYMLQGVTVYLDSRDANSTVDMRLYGDVGGDPGGAVLGELTGDVAFVGQQSVTFTPTSTFLLDPLTTYWVVLSGLSPTLNGVVWQQSNPDMLPAGLATAVGYTFSSSGINPPTANSSVYNLITVEGSVVTPEPGTLGLLAAALAAGYWYRRRKTA